MGLWDILAKYREGLLGGLFVTLKLCAIIWCSGILLGAALGAASAKWPSVVGLPVRVISFTLAGVPVLVVLFWLHFPAQALAGVIVDPFYTAAFALSLVMVFAVSDTVRSAVEHFPREWVTVARVCGLTRSQTFVNISLPLLLRQLTPSLLSLAVIGLQSTLFASLISVDELFRVCQRINAEIYEPIQVYTALAVLFLIVCLPLHGLAAVLRNRFARDFSER